MGKKTKQSALYSFLEQQGVLDIAGDAAFKSAKVSYYREYKRSWKQAKRHESKSFTVLYTPKEANRIVAAAEKSHTSPTNFVKEAALAASEGRPMADAVMLGELRELLALQYGLLQEVTEEQLVPEEIGNALMDRMEILERQVLGIISPNKLQVIDNQNTFKEVC